MLVKAYQPATRVGGHVIFEGKLILAHKVLNCPAFLGSCPLIGGGGGGGGGTATTEHVQVIKKKLKKHDR